MDGPQPRRHLPQVIQLSNLPALKEAATNLTSGEVAGGVSTGGAGVAGAGEGDSDGGGVPGSSSQQWGEAQVI